MIFNFAFPSTMYSIYKKTLFDCKRGRQTKTITLTPICACALKNRFRTIRQNQSQSIAKLQVRFLLHAPRCSNYNIQLKLGYSSIIDQRLKMASQKDRQEGEPIA